MESKVKYSNYEPKRRFKHKDGAKGLLILVHLESILQIK